MKNSSTSRKQLPLVTRVVSTLVVTSALLIGSAPVFAQDGSALEEIIVTAEFREANVQDTPLAITAVNADLLESRSQTNLAQITAQAPNVSLRPAGSAFGNALVAFIRGIGQTDFNPSVEPGVGIYVDDVYYSTITGNVLDLMDLDRVEVLRGPQGTLAGRNAIGGAIKLFTRKPDGNDDGYVGVTYGAYDRTEVRGAAGLTLVPDTLFARFAGTSRNSDGYVTRYDYACANNLSAPGTVGGFPTYSQAAACELGTEGGQSYTSGRMQLRWVVADNFEANLAASIVNDDSESQPGVLVAAKDHSNSLIFDPTQGSLVPIWYDNGAVGGGTAGVYDVGVDVPYDNRFATPGTFINYSTYVDDGTSTPHPLFQGSTPGANTQVYKPYVIDPINELEAWDVSLNLDWQLTDNIGLMYVMAYREYQNSFAEDTDGSPLGVQQLLQVMNHTQWTHEIRMNADIFDGKVDTTVGWFYLDQKTNEDARVDLPYVGFDFIHGPDLVPANNWAIYGHATWHVMDKVDISAGLRYSEDEKSYTFHRRNPDLTPVQPCVAPPFFFFFNPAGCGVYGLDGLPVEYSSDQLDFRTAITYDVNDDVMAYFQVASGYKAGGNNARPFFPSQLNAFQPETLLTYELGMKSTWWDQLRLNAAVFWNDYTEIQLPTNECTWANPGETTPCASQNNVGDAEVWGIELEAEWHATDALSFDASYSHLDFEYTDIAVLASGLPASAVTLDMISPYTPEDKWSIGAQYEWILDDLGSVTPRIDASYQGDVFAAAVNAPENLIESYALVNARLTWRSPSENWEIAAEFTNLADKYYYQTLFDLWGPVGYVHGQPGRPAEWALSVKRRF